MSLDLFHSIINQLRYPTQFLNLVGLGEPLLSPGIFSMIRYAKKHGLVVSLIDNFTLIDRNKSVALINSGLDFLYASFDSVSKNRFEKMRTGACFESVVKNVALFVKTRKEFKANRPVFFFKSTISQSNLTEIPELVKLAETLEVDGINFGRMVGDEEARLNYELIFLNEGDFPRSRIFLDPCELSKSYQCDALEGCYVTFDGKVLPCGLMAEAVPRTQYSQLQLGDLRFNTLGSIWRSPTYRQFRKNLESGKYLPQCAYCAGNKNLTKTH